MLCLSFCHCCPAPVAPLVHVPVPYPGLLSYCCYLVHVFTVFAAELAAFIAFLLLWLFWLLFLLFPPLPCLLCGLPFFTLLVAPVSSSPVCQSLFSRGPAGAAPGLPSCSCRVGWRLTPPVCRSSHPTSYSQLPVLPVPPSFCHVWPSTVQGRALFLAPLWTAAPIVGGRWSPALRPAGLHILSLWTSWG